jgi:type VI secretion system protein VasJ
MALTLDDVRARAKAFTAPISDSAPAGATARFDPRYEAIVGEMSKLDHPSGAPVDWKLVVAKSGELIQTTSKDLVLASQLAVGLYTLAGLDGLATGTVVLSDLIEQYWETLQPELKRLRGRVNAVAWFVERVGQSLGSREVGASDREAVAVLGEAVQKFGDVVRDKFGADAPAMRPLSEAVDRLMMSLPAEAPPPPPPSAAPAPTAAPSPSAAPVAAPPVAAPPVNVADPTSYLREVGSALASGANSLRRAQPADPAPYRAVRTGLWLHLAAPPPATGNKTAIPAPPEATRARFAQLAANAKWSELVDECESCLSQFRLWLDPHRVAAQALSSLGPSYAGARQALIHELGAFLRRFPGLIDLTFADGTPLAAADTRTWIEAEVLPQGQSGGSGPRLEKDESLEESRKLVADGKTAEAIELLQTKAGAAATAAQAFRVRLELAGLLLQTEQPMLARAIFAGLDEELRARGLDEWDPPLAAACLEGYLRCLRALTKAGKNVSEDTMLLYNRLCRLDLRVAMRLGF